MEEAPVEVVEIEVGPVEVEIEGVPVEGALVEEVPVEIEVVVQREEETEAVVQLVAKEVKERMEILHKQREGLAGMEVQKTVVLE